MDFSFEPDRNGGFDQDLMHANMGFAFEQDRHAGFDEDIMRAFVREDGPSFMRDVREAILENMSFGVYPNTQRLLSNEEAASTTDYSQGLHLNAHGFYGGFNQPIFSSTIPISWLEAPYVCEEQEKYNIKVADRQYRRFLTHENKCHCEETMKEFCLRFGPAKGGLHVRLPSQLLPPIKPQAYRPVYQALQSPIHDFVMQLRQEEKERKKIKEERHSMFLIAKEAAKQREAAQMAMEREVQSRAFNPYHIPEEPMAKYVTAFGNPSVYKDTTVEYMTAAENGPGSESVTSGEDFFDTEDPPVHVFDPSMDSKDGGISFTNESVHARDQSLDSDSEEEDVYMPTNQFVPSGPVNIPLGDKLSLHNFLVPPREKKSVDIKGDFVSSPLKPTPKNTPRSKALVEDDELRVPKRVKKQKKHPSSMLKVATKNAAYQIEQSISRESK